MEYDEMNDEQIQAEVLKAEDRYEDLKDRVHYQYEEIQQLKKKYEIMKENAHILAKRIDRAIELLNENYNALFIEEDVNYIGEGCYHDLLNILKGDDKK